MIIKGKKQDNIVYDYVSKGVRISVYACNWEPYGLAGLAREGFVQNVDHELGVQE